MNFADEEEIQAPLAQKGFPLGGFGSFPREGTRLAAKGQRQRLDIVPVFLSLVLPWVVFCLVYADMSFFFRFQQPFVAYCLVGVGLAFILLLGMVVLRSAVRKFYNLEGYQPSWLTFLFLTTVIAWVLGIVFGNLNYWTNMQPFYDYSSLSEYHGVTPAQHRGQALMDAGRLEFVNSTALDLTRSMGFKDDSTYCVAPITITSQENTLPLANYDFWAVGLDCCDSNVGNFHCGAYRDPTAHSGLRVLRDDQRAFFRLSVQMAEARYGIRASHPIFVYWTTNPTVEMEAFRDEGRKFYLIGMLVHFAWQLLAVGLAICGFGKLGH